jgi:hypothetical protein
MNIYKKIDNHNNDCSICLDSIDLNSINIITTECNHTFHGECILTWIKSEKLLIKCPYCRYPIDNNYIQIKYSEQLKNYTITQKTKYNVAYKKYITKILDKLKEIINNNINTTTFISYYKNIFNITFSISNNKISDNIMSKIQEQLYTEYNIHFKPIEIFKLLTDTILYIKYEITLNINDNNYLEEFLLELDNIERCITNKQRKKDKYLELMNDKAVSEMKNNWFNKKKK